MQVFHNKLIILICIAFLSLSLCACATDENQMLLGDWENCSEIQLLEQSGTQKAPLSIMTTCVSFFEDGTGNWASIFDDGHPSVSRSFTYVVESNMVTLNYEDGREENFYFSFSNGILTLEGEQSYWQLSRTK